MGVINSTHTYTYIDVFKQKKNNTDMCSFSNSLEYQLRLLIPGMRTPIISTTKFAEIGKRLGMKNRTIAQALETLHEFGLLLYVRGNICLLIGSYVCM